MPSKSKKQARFMAAAAHNPKFAKRVGIKQSVAKDFNQADAGTGILKGPIKKAVGGLSNMRELMQPRARPMGMAAPGRLQPARPAIPPQGGGLMNYLRGIQQQFGGMRQPGMGQPGMMPPQQALPAPMNPKAGGDFRPSTPTVGPNAGMTAYDMYKRDFKPGVTPTNQMGNPMMTQDQFNASRAANEANARQWDLGPVMQMKNPNAPAAPPPGPGLGFGFGAAPPAGPPGGVQMMGGPPAQPGQPLPPNAMMAYGGEFDTGDQLRRLVSRMAKGGEALSALKELAKKFFEALQTGDQNLANQLRQQMEAIQPGSTQGLPPAGPVMQPGAAPVDPGPQ